MVTTYERGRMQGQRNYFLRLLEAKYGPLSTEVKQRVEAHSPEAFDEVQIAILTAESLKDLHLED